MDSHHGSSSDQGSGADDVSTREETSSEATGQATMTGATPPPLSRSSRNTLRVFVIGLVLSIASGAVYYPVRTAERTVATKVCYSMASAAAATLGQNMQNIVSQTVDLAKLLEDSPPAEAGLYEELQRITLTDSAILEVGLGYVPGKAPGETGLYAPHFGKRLGTYQNFRVDSFYDYTTSDWFRNGLSHGSHWFRPYFGQATQSWVVGYVMPIRSPGANAGEYPAGVIRINYSLESIGRLVSQLPLGDAGTGFIVTRSGTLIHHSDTSHLEHHDTLGQLTQEIGAATVKTLTEDVRLFELTSHMYHNPIRGTVSIIIQQPIPSTEWALVTIFDVDEVAQSGGQGTLLMVTGNLFTFSMVLCIGALLFLLAPWAWAVLQDAALLWKNSHPNP